MKVVSTVTIQAFDRQDAAVFLRAKLGPGYAWQKMLEMWAKVDCEDGFRGNPDLRCEPSFTCCRKPKYTKADLEKFALQVRAIVPELAPTPLMQHSYEFDSEFPDRLPWRMRRARPCTKAPIRPTTGLAALTLVPGGMVARLPPRAS